MSDLIRQNTAATMLGVSRQYISKLVRTKKLKAYTEAKLVSRADVKKLLAKRDTP